ncbi:DUF2851 family protein [Algivirga pacifica]|uniref:DUF2851 family protein n=1 Tax=Algivirga pacifica TaxID=1162670 RepID=A0ABP9D472_9BACT
MQEMFFHYIWRLQYFEHQHLFTVKGESVSVIYPGIYNTNAGPDFFNAKILIGEMEWHGHVEIHVQASDWYKHQHQEDEAYDNVVLHVVWEADRSVYRMEGSEIATVELKGKIPLSLFQKYERMQQDQAIPCEYLCQEVPEILWTSMKERVLIERLEEKANQIHLLKEYCHGDWEQVALWVLGKSLGAPLNQEPFVELSKRVPFQAVKKLKENEMQLEALYFGQSGLLLPCQEQAYAQKLIREHQYLFHKYKLSPALSPVIWQQGRMRTPSLPTVRIAQLIGLITQKDHLFQECMLSSKFQDIKALLDVEVPSYWQTHYHFGKVRKKGTGKISVTMKARIAANGVVPLLVAYGQYQGNERCMEQGIQLLESLPPEDNKYIRLWKEMGLKVENAFDVQAYLQLYKKYCAEKQCLRCVVGCAILK